MIGKIKYGKSTIRYNIVKSKRRKTSQIQIDKDNVVIRTPYTKTNKEIQEIMENKSQWIFKNQLAFKKRKSEITKPTFSVGSTIPYMGKNYILKILLNQKVDSLKLKKSEITVLLQSKRLIKKQVQKIYEDWLFVKASKYLDNKTWKLASKTGITPSKIVVKSLKGRWGSATIDGTIRLNVNLLKFPANVIDYVIIHELCHLKIQNHSFHFWNLIKKFLPQYDERKIWLNQNGIDIF